MSSFRDLLKSDCRDDIADPRQNRNRIYILSVGSLDHGNPAHHALIRNPGFTLSIATDYPELWAIPKHEVIDIAILHNSLSSIRIEDACRFIRGRWPLTRILVLRNVQAFLEQALFDTCMEPNIDPTILLAVIQQLHAEPSHRRLGMFSISANDPMLAEASELPGNREIEETLDSALPPDFDCCSSDWENTVATFLEAAQQCRPQLMRLAQRFADNREEAEDIVQDALLNAFKFLPQFRGDSKMTTWLGAIVLNAGREWVRKYKAQVLIPLEFQRSREEAPIMFDVSDTRPNPEQIYQRLEMAEALRNAIDELTSVRKSAIRMCTLGGLSHFEAAKTLGVNVSTIKARISQGKGMLRRKLCLGTLPSDGLPQTKRMVL